ncbi:unnamed protein product [Cuscuta campestris]|uniref:Uncharacterized protein n=1 Tax=Cuscuta campestris TaxID=132261 RepID=A0A484LWE1_9ASTE|nr:unnamed protein product [Cuscuta campestris]
MCLADELFFQGQIFPLCQHPISTDSTSTALRCKKPPVIELRQFVCRHKPPRSWNRFLFSQRSPTPHIRLPKASSQ